MKPWCETFLRIWAFQELRWSALARMTAKTGLFCSAQDQCVPFFLRVLPSIRHLTPTCPSTNSHRYLSFLSSPIRESPWLGWLLQVRTEDHLPQSDVVSGSCDGHPCFLCHDAFPCSSIRLGADPAAADRGSTAAERRDTPAASGPLSAPGLRCNCNGGFLRRRGILAVLIGSRGRHPP